MAALRAVQALCVRSLGGVSTTPRGYCQYFLICRAKKLPLISATSSAAHIFERCKDKQFSFNVPNNRAEN